MVWATGRESRICLAHSTGNDIIHISYTIHVCQYCLYFISYVIISLEKKNKVGKPTVALYRTFSNDTGTQLFVQYISFTHRPSISASPHYSRINIFVGYGGVTGKRIPDPKKAKDRLYTPFGEIKA